LKFFSCPNPLMLFVFCVMNYAHLMYGMHMASAARAWMYREPQEDWENFLSAVNDFSKSNIGRYEKPWCLGNALPLYRLSQRVRPNFSSCIAIKIGLTGLRTRSDRITPGRQTSGPQYLLIRTLNYTIHMSVLIVLARTSSLCTQNHYWSLS
jgi:hypothetical protein